MEVSTSDSNGEEDGDCHDHLQECNISHFCRWYNPKKDAQAILSLHKLVFSYSNEPMPTISELNSMRGYVIDVDIGVKVMGNGGNGTNGTNGIGGYLLFSKHELLIKNNDEKQNSWYYLDYIGVNPTYQGMRIGMLLLNRFKEYLDVTKSYGMLHVEESTIYSSRLVEWYSRNGFKVLQTQIQSEDTPKVKLTSMVRFCSEKLK